RRSDKPSEPLAAAVEGAVRCPREGPNRNPRKASCLLWRDHPRPSPSRDAGGLDGGLSEPDRAAGVQDPLTPPAPGLWRSSLDLGPAAEMRSGFFAFRAQIALEVERRGPAWRPPFSAVQHPQWRRAAPARPHVSVRPPCREDEWRPMCDRK